MIFTEETYTEDDIDDYHYNEDCTNRSSYYTY